MFVNELRKLSEQADIVNKVDSFIRQKLIDDAELGSREVRWLEEDIMRYGNCSATVLDEVASRLRSEGIEVIYDCPSERYSEPTYVFRW